MTPQEAQIIRDIFARVRQMGPAPRDPDALAAIDYELRSNPDAMVGLVRAVVALDRERAALLEEIERLRGGEQDDHAAPGYGGPYGHEGYREPPGYGAPQEEPRRDPWNRTGASPYEPQRPDPRWEPQRPAEPAREPWGSPPWGRSRSSLDTRPMPPQAPQPGPWGGRTEPAQGAPGGGILGTVAGAAAGMAGGLFAYEALKGVLGGSNQGGGLFGSANASESKDQGSGSGFETGGSMDDGGGDFFGLGDLFDDN